jgi:uncharacterized membrane protein YphA (DoxX/SURF4 family)
MIVDVLLAVPAALLALEFVLHGLGMVARMEAGIDPIVKHTGYRPGPVPLTLLGLVDFAVATGFVIGVLLWTPAGLVSAVYSVFLFGGLLVIRLRRRLGTLVSPPDFPVFLVLGVLALIIAIVRLT